MRKKLPINRLRKKAWGIVSEVIRREAADPDGYVECVTCGKKEFWKKVHCGHYYHGHVRASFLEQTNLAPQCCTCNLYKSGNLIEYGRYQEEKHGKDKMEWLRQLHFEAFKPTRDYYDKIIEVYQERLKKLDRRL